MDEATISRFITDTFAGVTTATASGSTFFFVGPEQKFPFATVVTADDAYDNVSNLDRPGVFRLNVGVGKKTFQSLFPAGGADPDYTALDRLMPHPVYGKMYWACVLNPSDKTFREIQPLLTEAYETAARKHGPAGME